MGFKRVIDNIEPKKLKGKMMTNKFKVLLLCLVFSIVLMSQSMAADLQEETGPGNPYNPFPTDKVVVTKVKHFGVVCWKIAAAGSTFYFENGNETDGSTGFNSAFNLDGNDWIGADNELGYNTVPGCKGWGHRGQVTLKTPGNESYIALLDVVEAER